MRCASLLFKNLIFFFIMNKAVREFFRRLFSFFLLDQKEPKNQGCVCWATRFLHSAVHAANSRSALKQRRSRPLRSARSLYAHQTEAGINGQLTIDNGQFPVRRGGMLPPFCVPTGYLRETMGHKIGRIQSAHKHINCQFSIVH